MKVKKDIAQLFHMHRECRAWRLGFHSGKKQPYQTTDCSPFRLRSLKASKSMLLDEGVESGGSNVEFYSLSSKIQ